MVLDSCDVSSVGKGLEGLCPLVEELHLSSNQLSDWSNVSSPPPLCVCVWIGVNDMACAEATIINWCILTVPKKNHLMNTFSPTTSDCSHTPVSASTGVPGLGS